MLRLATINLEATDPQQCKRLYVEALGMTEDARRSHGETFVYLSSASTDITIAKPESGAVSPPGRMEIGFETDDVPAIRARLEELGIPYEARSMGWGDALELADTEGHRVVVYKLRRSP